MRMCHFELLFRAGRKVARNERTRARETDCREKMIPARTFTFEGLLPPSSTAYNQENWSKSELGICALALFAEQASFVAQASLGTSIKSCQVGSGVRATTLISSFLMPIMNNANHKKTTSFVLTKLMPLPTDRPPCYVDIH
jgi:hypothetical protein